MYSRGNKTIFGQKIESSLFRPKITKNGPKRPHIYFWFKNRKSSFSTKYYQKLTPEATYWFLVQKWKVNFFDRKLSKTDARGHKSIFGQKIESSLFPPKMNKNAPQRSEIDFWWEKLNLQFFDQKCPKCTSRGPKSILGQQIESSLFKPKWPKMHSTGHK